MCEVKPLSPLIAFSVSAVSQLLQKPGLGRRRDGDHGGRVPILAYFRRSYTTRKDGIIVQHGDGFVLTTIDPSDVTETNGLVLRIVPVTTHLAILVGGDDTIMSARFTIGWSDGRFTREPR